jgi:uncharacterized membrane protein YhhN
MKILAAFVFATAVYFMAWRLGERHPLWIPGVVVIVVGIVFLVWITGASR